MEQQGAGGVEGGRVEGTCGVVGRKSEGEEAWKRGNRTSSVIAPK